MFILKKGHQPGVYVPLRALFLVESCICASGSLDRVMTGKHFNRALRVHKLVLEALVRLLLVRFEEVHPRDASLSKEAFKLLMDLIENPGIDTASKIKHSEEFRTYFDKFNAFKSEALNGIHGKTAQVWTKYMTIIETILILIRATKENDLDLHIAALIIATMQGMYLATL